MNAGFLEYSGLPKGGTASKVLWNTTKNKESRAVLNSHSSVFKAFVGKAWKEYYIIGNVAFKKVIP